jgi:hypothetical protein
MKSTTYTCDVCAARVHYPIPYPPTSGTGYLCHSCLRYLTTAIMLEELKSDQPLGSPAQS